MVIAARAGSVGRREIARDLIVGGHARALLGLPEGQWVDVKSAPYDLTGDSGRYELAKDVSAFANGGGGLILIPGRTIDDPNGEVIDHVGDLSLGLVDTGQIRSILADWIYPLIEGLEVLVIETSAGITLCDAPPAMQRLR